MSETDEEQVRALFETTPEPRDRYFYKQIVSRHMWEDEPAQRAMKRDMVRLLIDSAREDGYRIVKESVPRFRIVSRMKYVDGWSTDDNGKPRGEFVDVEWLRVPESEATAYIVVVEAVVVPVAELA